MMRLCGSCKLVGACNGTCFLVGQWRITTMQIIEAIEAAFRLATGKPAQLVNVVSVGKKFSLYTTQIKAYT